MAERPHRVSHRRPAGSAVSLSAAGALAAWALLAGPAAAAPPRDAPPASSVLAFAGGSTSGGAQDRLLLANPARDPATVRVTAYPEGGAPGGLATGVTLAPGAWQAVDLDALAPDARFGLVVEADRPIAADETRVGEAASVSAVGQGPVTTWWLTGDSGTGGTVSVVVFNPNGSEATLQIRY